MAAGSGAAETYFLVYSFAGSDFSTLGELIVIVGNPEHDRLSCWLFHYFGERSHFFTALPPMIWVIGQDARRRWWVVIGH